MQIETEMPQFSMILFNSIRWLLVHCMLESISICLLNLSEKLKSFSLVMYILIHLMVLSIAQIDALHHSIALRKTVVYRKFLYDFAISRYV